MTLKERYEKGRRCAYGIGQMTDLKGAHEMWCGIEHMLSADDRKVYSYIKECLDITDAPRVLFDFPSQLGTYNPVASHMITVAAPIENVADGRTESQLRALFREVLTLAQKTGKLDSLYKTLEKFRESAKVSPTEKKKNPKHVRLGNNLRYYIYRFWTSTDNYYASMNEYRRKKGLEPKKSVQGVYQVISGKNGMDSSGKMILVEMVNAFNKRQPRLKRDIEVKDLDLPLSATLALFIEPKRDEKTEELLREEKREA